MREDNPPAVAPGGALLAGGWRVADDPLELARHRSGRHPPAARAGRRRRGPGDRPALRRDARGALPHERAAAGRPGPGRRRAHGDRGGHGQRRQRRPRRSPGPHGPQPAGAGLRAEPRAGARSSSTPRTRAQASPPARSPSGAARPSGRFPPGWRADGWSRACAAARGAAGPSARPPPTTSGAPARSSGRRCACAPGSARASAGRRRGSLSRPRTVRGRLLRHGGRPLAGQPITVVQTVSMDGAQPQVVAVAQTGADGRFRATVPPGPSRSLRVTSPGTGGLQAGLRKLFLRVRWRSTLRLSPRVRARGRPRADLRPAAPRRSAAAAVGQAGGAAGLRPRPLAALRLDAGARAAGPVGHELSLRRRPRHLPHAGADPARRPPAVRARLLAGRGPCGWAEASRAARSRAPSARRRTTRPSRGSRPRGSRRTRRSASSDRGGRGRQRAGDAVDPRLGADQVAARSPPARRASCSRTSS